MIIKAIELSRDQEDKIYHHGIHTIKLPLVEDPVPIYGSAILPDNAVMHTLTITLEDYKKNAFTIDGKTYYKTDESEYGSVYFKK